MKFNCKALLESRLIGTQLATRLIWIVCIVRSASIVYEEKALQTSWFSFIGSMFLMLIGDMYLLGIFFTFHFSLRIFTKAKGLEIIFNELTSYVISTSFPLRESLYRHLLLVPMRHQLWLVLFKVHHTQLGKCWSPFSRSLYCQNLFQQPYLGLHWSEGYIGKKLFFTTS